MPQVELDVMPDDARVWVFATDRPLAAGEESTLLERVDGFLEGWKAHGTPLTCARDWREGRFLIVAVDERTAPPSGCSIDAMVHVLQGAEADLGVRLVDRTPVWFRQDGEVRTVPRGEFRGLAARARVGADTVVFDTTLTRLHQVRAGELERPAAESWHRALLPED